MLFGLGVGNLVSLPPLIAQSEFRPADVGTVVALVTAINQAVFALAPAIFGALRDYTGNYVVAFLMAAAAQVVAQASSSMAGGFPRRKSPYPSLVPAYSTAGRDLDGSYIVVISPAAPRPAAPTAVFRQGSRFS
jgi:hypothetical protein